MSYPRFLYHKDLAPAGRLIRDETAEPTEEGWVDTPQKFDPTYVEPPKLVPDGSVPADRPGYIPQPFPSVRYSASGEARTVQTAEEDALLDPAEWKHSPAAFLPTPAVPVAAPVQSSTPPPVPVAGTHLEPVPDGRVPLPPPVGDDPATPIQLSAAKQKAALYDAAAADVVAQVGAMSDIEKLQVVKGFEETNPKKRVTVMKAVDKRLAELGYVPPAA